MADRDRQLQRAISESLSAWWNDNYDLHQIDHVLVPDAADAMASAAIDTLHGFLTMRAHG